MAAAAVDCHSARIGDGADMLARGIVSHANVFAARCGVIAGQACSEAAGRLRGALPPRAAASPFFEEGRWQVRGAGEDAPEIWALDSIGKVVPADGGRILVIGSHGALHGGRPESALPVDARAAVFHDAGVGADRIGISRLPVLARRGIAAATVAGDSARIGDGRSLWASGVLSHVNAIAASLGVAPGMSVVRFADLVCAAQKTDLMR